MANYISNREFLIEIAKSKTTYSSYENRLTDTIPDLILRDVNLISQSIEEGMQARAKRLQKTAYDEAVISYEKSIPAFSAKKSTSDKPKLDDFYVDPSTVQPNDVVFRVMMWDHIPLLDLSAKDHELLKLEELLPKTSLVLFEEDDEVEIEDEVIEPEIVEELALTDKEIKAKHVKVNFPPFQHFRIDENNRPYCVGKSHWKGDLHNGSFSKDHGRMTNKLGEMFIMLSNRYASRGNWRGYCVDIETEALTQRGWLKGTEITEDDIILSYESGDLKWSQIKSIYRDENYDGLMHKMTSVGFDALVTPGHKWVTDRGIVQTELLKKKDRLTLLGNAVSSVNEIAYSDELVELIGWIVTEGNYEYHTKRNVRELKTIRIYQNAGPKADRIRNCLKKLDLSYKESLKGKLTTFYIHKKSSALLGAIIPDKDLTMEFILALSEQQQSLLLNTMIDGDGWKTGPNKSYLHYAQKNAESVGLFQALCTLNGKRSNSHYCDTVSFGKPTYCHVVNVFVDGHHSMVENIDFNGGYNAHRGGSTKTDYKVNHPNFPTVEYKGLVWCPETEYGSFVCRRNGTVYLSGNSYRDEMEAQALLQLSKVGLQFDESKSNNPFAFYTTITTHSFYGVLSSEKRNQTIRDDILEMNNLNPSYTRQGEKGSSYDSDE